MCQGIEDMRPDCARAFGEITVTQQSHGEILHRIDAAVNGNGKPGLERRVVDLEALRAQQAHAAMRRAVIGAALSIIAKILLDWFQH
ncbi:MAG: hypothetical protein NTV86_13115 [Planctomycetota bacterium]|nr:hypothetical protein [Planctomycetota bacterium]